MRDLIRRIIKEDLNYWHVDDATKDEFNMGILSEGRWDSITRQIVKDIMSYVKGEPSAFDEDDEFEEGEHIYKHKGLHIPVDIELNWNDDGVMEVISEHDPDTDGVVIEMDLNYSQFPQAYESLFYKLQEDVRHEIEHILQTVDSNRPEITQRHKDDDYTQYEYYTLPDEIPALVHGLYRRAKLQRKPLISLMIQEVDKYIQNGSMTELEGTKVLRMWIDFARKNLPHTQL